MKIELNESEVWLLVETLESWANAIEHLEDEEYNKQLNSLEWKLRDLLPEHTNGKINRS